MTASVGWESWKLAHAYHRIGSGTTPTSGNADYYDDEIGTPWITTSELRETYIKHTSTNVTQLALDDFTTLRTYAPNSVFMAMYGATIGRLGISTIPATCNQACCVFERSDKFDNRFLFYWLWHRRAELISLSVGGGQPNLSQQDLKSEKALCPPLETQKRIAAFLDEKTAQIDGLISRKQALLERLAEKRQAIITQAVTKGLNPDAPLKDSGIDWLGQIPAHWDVKRVKHIAKLESGHTPDKKIDAYWDDADIPWVSLNDTAEIRACDYIADTKFKTNALGIANSSARLLPAEAVVFTRDATIGECAITTRPMAVSQHIIAWICNQQVISPEYLLFLIYGMTGELRRITNGATIGTIGLGDVKELSVCVPSVDEQSQITQWVFDLKARIDQTADNVRSSMARLNEYRAALITSAVTGQIEDLQ